MKTRTLYTDGTDMEISTDDGKLIVRAFELFATTRTAARGYSDGTEFEEWQLFTVCKLLSLETGMDEGSLKGLVKIAYDMINREHMIWNRWVSPKQYFPLA